MKGNEMNSLEEKKNINETPKVDKGTRRRGFLAPIFLSITGGIEPKIWLVKFVPLLILQGTSIFAYTIVKNAKSSVFVKATGGSSVITFLKLLIILPISALFPLLLSFLTKIVNNKREKVPYILLAIFIGFFLIFMTVLLPYGHVLQFPQLIINFLMSIPFVPIAFAEGIGQIVGYWDYSIFYGMSEMVAVIFINMIAWGVANEICSAQESKTFYPLFGGFTAITSFLAAQVLLKTSLSSASTNAGFIALLQGILVKVVLSLIGFLLTYIFIERVVMKNQQYVGKKEQKTKYKADVGSGYKMILKNPYLRNIAIIVLSYALLIFMYEQCFYESINTVNKQSYSSVLAVTAKVNALMTFVMSILAVWLRSLPWVVRAMLPVVMCGGGGLVSVALFIMQGSTAAVATSAVVAIASSPLVISVIIGAAGNVMARSAKYSLFDSTKEELFRSSTDPDIRSKGKAVVDVTCGRIGKSGSAFLIAGLLGIQPIFIGLFQGRGQSDTKETTVQSVPIKESAKQQSVNVASLLKTMLSVKDNDANKEVLVSIDLTACEKAGYKMKQTGDRIEISIPKPSASAQLPGKEVDATKGISTNNHTVTGNKDAVAQVNNQSHNTTSVDSGISGKDGLSVGLKNTIQPGSIKSSKIHNKVTVKDIAPVIFILAVVIVIMWGYAVLSIAPAYEANIRESEGESKMKSPYMTPGNCLTLALVAICIFGSAYALLALWVPPILLKGL